MQRQRRSIMLRHMKRLPVLLTTTPPTLRYAAAIAFTLITTVALLQSSTKPLIGPAAPEGPPDLTREIFLTIGHITAFGGLVLLWTWALASRLPLARALTLTVTFALVYGLATEIAQSAVPDRNASLYDLIVNTLTVAAAAWSIWQMRFRFPTA